MSPRPEEEDDQRGRSEATPSPTFNHEQDTDCLFDENEDTPDTLANPIKVYATRWYILGVFSFLGLLQGMIWNTFGPISNSVLALFCPHWSDSTLALFGNWGNIMYVIPVIPVMAYFEKKGLRSSLLMTAALVTAGTFARVIPFKITFYTLMCHLCAILNGIAGIVVFAGASALSVTWFPPTERTTATAVAIVANNLGNAGSFLIGPAIVPDPGNVTLTNVTEDNYHNTGLGEVAEGFFSSAAKELSQSLNSTIKWCPVLPDAEMNHIYHRLRILMYLDLILAAACMFAIMAYFPAKPKSPPSISSTTERMDFLPGIKAICTNKNAILITICFSLFNGLISSWYTVMVITFDGLPLGNDKDKTIGYIGMWSILCNTVTTLIVSRIMDFIRGKMKLALFILMVSSALCWLWLTLICLQVIPFSLAQLYTSTLLASGLTYASGPIFFEFGVELVYPVPEGLVGGFLTCFYNLAGMVFLFLFDIPGSGKSTHWILYTILGSVCSSIPLLFLVKERYNRSVVDQFQEPRSTTTEHASYSAI